jgi:integrase
LDDGKSLGDPSCGRCDPNYLTCVVNGGGVVVALIQRCLTLREVAAEGVSVAKVQRIELDGLATWTVLGEDHLPIVDVEIFLEHLRVTGRSPNTVKSYARALALWFDFLALQDCGWADVSLERFGEFLGWLTTGLPPDVAPITERPRQVSDETVALRLQGVRSFYAFHQRRGHDVAPGLFEWGVDRSPYRAFLHHVSRRDAVLRATVTVRRRRAKAPTLTPRQLTAIEDDCATRDETGWHGSVRDRLFFSLLEETGLRIGEALSLQHGDWHSGLGENPYIEVVPRPHPLGLRVKSGEYRKLYVSDSLDRLYGEYLWECCDAGLDLEVPSVDEHYVFVNLRGGVRFAPMRPESIYKLTRRISAHLPGQLPEGWSPHWFRHTHATALLLAGVPVHVVSRRLGHRDVQTTLDRYAWVIDDEDLRSLADWRAITKRWGRAG